MTSVTYPDGLRSSREYDERGKADGGDLAQR
uniref:RHS repeat protein n=1 Tax=Escherichia coli TaxID=562 RepID=A0A6N0IED8_ECOLX|nr:hypothetical protein HPE44_00285 [Escherichia coli]